MKLNLFPFAVALLIVGLIAVLDIAVVEFILNVAGITDQYVHIWHIAMFAIFIPGLIVIIWTLFGRLGIAIWTAGLIAGGWEDALYFFLQGRVVPAELPWHPYLMTELAVYLGMTISFVVLWVITRRLK